jgi:hypothetical protein
MEELLPDRSGNMNVKPVKTSFKLSQTKALSKIEWCLHANHLQTAFPTSFNREGFNKDLKGLVIHSNTLHDLKMNVIGISDEYIFPPATFTLILKNESKMTISGQEERRFLKEEELGLNDPQGFCMYVRATGKSVYIPKVNFSNCHGFYELPEDITAGLAGKGYINMKGVQEVEKTKIEYASLDRLKTISKHSWSMMFTPLINPATDLGMMVFTYRPPFIFNDRDNEGILGLEYFVWNAMLAKMASYTLQKLAKLGQINE